MNSVFSEFSDIVLNMTTDILHQLHKKKGVSFYKRVTQYN